MTADDFIREFELLADAPNGVQKLREMVLQLAVQGKLVPQMLEEPSARKCLAESCSGITDIALQDDETLPVGWEALSLGCLIATNTGGGTPSKQRPTYWGGAIPWASVKDIKEEKYLTGTIDTITEEGLENSSSNLIPAGRLIVVTRMGLGKLAINKIDVAINQDLRALEPIDALDIDFAYILFKTLKLVGKGVTVKGITVKALHAVLVSLPPLAEQKRIVAKVDELMRLCDELEERQARKNESRVTLNASCLNALLDISDGRQSNGNAKRIFDNFDILYDNPANVTELRKAILHLAVQGRLVAQAPEDGSAAEILERVANEKERLIRDGLLAKRKPTEAVTEAERPYLLPEGWQWTRLGSICLFENGDRSSNYPSGNDIINVGVPFVSTKAIFNHEVRLDNVDFISEEKFNSLRSGKLRDGDILVVLRGSVGKLGIFNATEKHQTGFINAQLVILRNYLPDLIPYCLQYMTSPVFQTLTLRRSTGSAQPQLSASQLAQVPIPLPPLEEQRRIVGRLETLLKLCSRLEHNMDLSLSASQPLLESVASQLSFVGDMP
jgi:type I restriction enzyme S subunit